jgi:hypothetical protein
VLTVDGVLDATTYLPMLEAIVKAALDEPRIVIIDISWLTVREDSFLSRRNIKVPDCRASDRVCAAP